MVGPPGNRPAVPRDWSEAYLNGTSQEPTPEDARKDGHIRGQQVIHEISGLEQKGTFIASVIRSITPMQPDNTHV